MVCLGWPIRIIKSERRFRQPWRRAKVNLVRQPTWWAAAAGRGAGRQSLSFDQTNISLGRLKTTRVASNFHPGGDLSSYRQLRGGTISGLPEMKKLAYWNRLANCNSDLTHDSGEFEFPWANFSLRSDNENSPVPTTTAAGRGGSSASIFAWKSLLLMPPDNELSGQITK